MSNYIVTTSYSLETLQKEVSTLVDKGYIPSGGITQVTYKSKFYTDSMNHVSYNATYSDMRIQFIQALYKPQTNSI